MSMMGVMSPPPGLEAPHHFREDERHFADTATSSLVETLKNALMRDAEERMTQQLQAVWRKGQEATTAFQREQEKGLADLEEMVATFRKSQQVLEEQNKSLKQAVIALSSRLLVMADSLDASPSFGGVAGPCWGLPPTPSASSSLPGAPPGLDQVMGDESDVGVSCKAPAPTAAPLSLANALGFGVRSIEEPVDAYVFGLTLRVADGAEMGLVCSTSPVDSTSPFVRIESIMPGGAAEAWNRQCGSSGAAEKVLRPGDKIVRVNDQAHSADQMLKECKSARLLRLQVVRVGEGVEEVKEQALGASPSKLRAEAVEFVPGGSSKFCIANDEVVPPFPISLQSAAFPDKSKENSVGSKAASSDTAESVEKEKTGGRSGGCRRGRRGARAGRSSRMAP